jgi:hypothetical protein
MKTFHRTELLDALKDYEHETVIFSDGEGSSIRVRIFNLDGEPTATRRPGITFVAMRATPHPKKNLWADGKESLKKSCITLREAMTWLQIPYKDGTLPPDA